MNTSTSRLAHVRSAFSKHKVLTTVIIVTCLVGGYGIYTSAKRADVTPEYQIERIRMGNIVQTVTGTGSVSAENQLSITSQVSGTIEGVDVSVGQHVNTGDLIATIDPTNALNSLQNAQIALAKLTEAPKATDLSNAENSVTQSYSSAFNSISGFYLDLQTIMPGLNSLLYDQGAFLSDQNSTQLTPTAQSYRNTAGISYDKANAEYQGLLSEYASLTRESSTSTVAQDLSDAYGLAKDVANTLEDMQNAITYITTNQSNYLAKDAATTQANVVAWSNTANGDVASLLSAQTSITTAENSLTDLVTSADPLDIQADQLAVQEAQQTYDDYFIRAPFDGTIGLLPVSVYGQAGNGTSIATIIGDQMIATLSLDEVDAAKVKTGDPVSLTFDAISNFTATGTVSEIDQVGTISAGVVAYGVKVTINTADSRILPGMSVNATITTDELDDVLIVPSTAVKTQGARSYVPIFSAAQVNPLIPASPGYAGLRSASSTGAFASSTEGFASSTGGFASSTFTGARSSGLYGSGSYAGGTGGAAAVSRTVTISTSLVPTNQVVTTGLSDDTNTQILSGLTVGEWVVLKTVAANQVTAATAAAPSLLSSLSGGGRGGFGGAGGGAARTAAPAAAARPAGN